MDTYTVLLVDDEEEVIRVILKKIDWSGLGFSVIGYANNGVKALELMEEYQPDVVITDIKMPYMDGLELSGHIRTDYPAARIVIFTGFDEFEYAKEAVHLEVEEYVLKPVNSTELSEVLGRLKRKLDQEIQEKRSAEVMQKYYMESLPFLQANIYSALIEGRIQRTELEKYRTDYQLSFSGPLYCCLVIHTSSMQVPEGMNPVLLSLSVQRQAEEFLGEDWRIHSFSYLGNTVFIVQLKHENEMPDLTDECDRFCKYAKRILGAVVTIGIGKVSEDILDMDQSYTEARAAVSYRVIYGTSKAINMKEIEPCDNRKMTISSDMELTNLFKAIRISEGPGLQRTVGRYLEQNIFCIQSLQQYQASVMEMVSALYHFASNNDIRIPEFTDNLKTLYGEILDMETEAVRTWFLRVCQILHDKLVTAQSRTTRSLVERARDYVELHYGDEELSLDIICDVLGVSNSYFSTVFKKETGDSFIGYLTDYRMEKAARLLNGTNEKSYIIAKKVGYGDPNYFSYVFKRKYGVSPSKYRSGQDRQ